MHHSFDVDVAKEVGVLAATVFNSVGSWADRERAVGLTSRDGAYWVRDDEDAWPREYPYATEGQVKKAFSALHKAGYVKTEHHDNTTYHALTEKGEALFYGRAYTEPEPEPESPKVDAFGESINRVIDHLNEATRKEFKKGTRTTRSKVKSLLEAGYSVEDICAVIDRKCSEWLNDRRMNQYLRPQTLFAMGNFEGYFNQSDRGGRAYVEEWDF